MMEKAFVYDFTIEELRECLNSIEDGGGDNRSGTEIDRFFRENDVLSELFPIKFTEFKRKKFMEEI